MFTRNGRSAAQQPQQQQRQQQQQQQELQKKLAKAERVRKLWSEFELWLRQPRIDMERDRDQLLLHTGNINSPAVKTSRRRIEEAHFSKAREEWQRRLRSADLKESDWDPMNPAEMKAVEEALGVDDEEGYITDPSPSPPHRPVHPHATPPSSLAPPEANRSASSLTHGSGLLPVVVVAAPAMTTASRTTSSASSSYECVNPNDFHSDDEESTSDSEFSSFSSTLISEEDEVVGPVAEFMIAQALVETGNIVAPREVLIKENHGPVLSRKPNALDPAPNAGPPPQPPLAPPKRPPDAKQQKQKQVPKASGNAAPQKASPPVPSQSLIAPTSASTSTPAASTSASNLASTSTSTASTSTSSTSASSSTSSASSSTSSASSSTTKPKSTRVQYPLVAPSLSDLSDFDDDIEADQKDRLSPSLVAQFEAQFEARKLEIRIEKIKQFHQLAQAADIELSIMLADGRREGTYTKQDEAELVEEHYQETVALRERMEKERKEQVNEEKKKMREEFSRRKTSFSSSSNQNQKQHAQGPQLGLRQQQPQPESDSEDDAEDEFAKRIERMRQEQLFLQAQFGSHEPQNAQQQPATATRKRAGTLTESAPAPIAVANHHELDEPSEVLTPRPPPKASAWSVKPAASRGPSNVLNQNLSRKGAAPVSSQTSSRFGEYPAHETEEVDHHHLEVDNEEEGQEQEENTGFWSTMTFGGLGKKKAPAPAPNQSPWNFAPTQKSPQKTQTAKSRLDIVTSAWDDDFGVVDEKEVVEDVHQEIERETRHVVEEREDAPQEKTPIIPSAPAPVMNKKQSKKQQRQAKKGCAKADKIEKEEPPTPAPAPSSTSKAQGGGNAKPTPAVAVPGKGKKGSLFGTESDDLSSTPRPSVLKRLQAQLTNEEVFSEQEDDAPTTPRPAVAKKSSLQVNNPWARTIGKAASRMVVEADHFDEDVANVLEAEPVSRTMVDQVNSKKAVSAAPEDVASSPQVPGSWQWGSGNTTVSNSKGKNKAEPPAPAATASGPRKNSSARQTAAPAVVDSTESNKKKGKKAQRVANANNAWAKRTTVEEVPDDEGEDLLPVSQTEKLPYNSRSILEAKDSTSPSELDEQPRIHEPKPSKPRAVFENIFQYEGVTSSSASAAAAAAASARAHDPGLVHELKDGLSDWSEERIKQAVARMAQESAEMERMVNGHTGLGGHNPPYAPSTSSMASVRSASSAVGMNGMNGINNGLSGLSGLNGPGVVASMSGAATMNGSGAASRNHMNGAASVASMHGSTAHNGFGTSKPASAVESAPKPVPKQVRWQSQSSLPTPMSRFESDPARSQPQTLAASMGVSRSYEDEAFSPFSGYQSSFSSYGGSNAKVASGWSTINNPKIPISFSGNGVDAEPEGELERMARTVLENMQFSASSQTRNKPGFAAV